MRIVTHFFSQSEQHISNIWLQSHQGGVRIKVTTPPNDVLGILFLSPDEFVFRVSCVNIGGAKQKISILQSAGMSWTVVNALNQHVKLFFLLESKYVTEQMNSENMAVFTESILAVRD